MSTGEDLVGKKALVVGASRGMGRAIALALAQAGADVVGVARSLDALKGVEEDVRGAGRNFLPIACDIADVDASHQLVADADEWGGAIDVLVNVAAIVGETMPPDLTPEDWDAVFAVNLRGTFFLTQEVGKRMLAGDGGAIVNIASVAGELSATPMIAYETTKAGLLQMTRGLAHFWAPKVRVNAISPGFVLTDMNREWLADPAVLSGIEERTPLGRVGAPPEVAAAAVFLASPASSYVTGHNLRVDGGWAIL
jgi:NAD(P)-dependent dehydrogenase (short-subunit alcohol dehydrogenase family)